MTATAMTNRKFAMGLLTGMVISLITNGIYQMQTSSTFYSGKVYKVNLPDLVKRHFSSNSSTFQTEVKLEYDSSTVSSTSSTSSTTSTTSTTPPPSTKVNDHDPEAQTTKVKAPKVVNGTVELETIEELCRELSRGAAPTYPPLPTIEHHLPYHTVNHIAEDRRIAALLFQKVRVLCWVMTSPETLTSKALHTYVTWGHRCNKILYVSSNESSTFPAPVIGLEVAEGRGHLTAKTMQAFKYIYDNHYDEADWFMKADDDTFVVLENLRYFLADRDPKEPVYYGHHFSTFVKPNGYYSGGGGYVISKEALRRFGLKGATNESLCAKDSGAEDTEFGKCMQNLGVLTADSYDETGRSRFHAFHPDFIKEGVYPDWYIQIDTHDAKKGYGAISEYPISFHYMTPKDMYQYEFYFYHLKVYGITYQPLRLRIHEHYVNTSNTSS